MPRSDAQTLKAPFILPPKPAAESRGVQAARRGFAVQDAQNGLSIDELLRLRRRLED